MTTARRLASHGFDVVVLDPGPEGDSAAIGHGVASVGHVSDVASIATRYGDTAATKYVRRTVTGFQEISQVLAAGDVPHQAMPLHDRSLGESVAARLEPWLALIRSAGADARMLTKHERGSAGPGVVSDALVVDPKEYAHSLAQQVRKAGAEILQDVTITHLVRRDGVSLVAYRENVAWARRLATVRATAVVDTIGVSPWGRLAAVNRPRVVPLLWFRPAQQLEVVRVEPGSPVWLARPFGDDAVAYGTEVAAGKQAQVLDEMSGWVAAQGGEVVGKDVLTVDPSDSGRPICGASAIPGGFYARGNGHAELVNGTACGCHLAELLLGRRAANAALPWRARARARVRNRLRSRHR